jgi:hypothetical protein
MHQETVSIAAFGFKCTLPIASTMKDKNYVLRPWTEEEDADFLAFCETIDVPPTDPELALAMEDGDLDFFNNDIFIGLKLHSC